MDSGESVIDRIHFDYFRQVSAKDYALYFDYPGWSDMVLRLAHAEPSIYHAALAISALSRNRYHPIRRYSQVTRNTLEDYATSQFGQAIQLLNNRLDKSDRSAELAAMASIIFFHFESLRDARGSKDQIIHVRGGLSIARSVRQPSQTMHFLTRSLQHLAMELVLYREL
jgi:hypothetical protein